MTPWRSGIRTIGGVALLVLLAPATPPLLAVGPAVWTLQTPAEIEQGKLEAVAVTARGGIQLARTAREVPVKALEENAQPFLWSEAVDSRGNLFVGSGNEGRVFRIPRGGPGTLFFSSSELAVQALAVDPRDNLYAGTSPEGKVYRITPDGKSEVWFDPDERYIWALANDRSGNLFVATGEQGIIYKVTDRQKAAPFFDSEESHLVSLAFDRQGNLLAGSSGKGLLYRITPDGKASVLLDSPLKEINALAVDAGGNIYASAIQAETPTPRVAPIPRVAGDGSVVVAVTGPTGEPTLEMTEENSPEAPIGAPTAPSGRKARSLLYRIEPDGIVTTAWSSESETLFALAVSGDKELFLGTGDQGKVRRLETDGSASLVARLASTQVTSLAALPDGALYAASSNTGRVYLLEKEAADAGTYLSPPRDAGSRAKWGRIGWHGDSPSGTRVELFTRSGNSAIPDATWSEWSPAYVAPAGSAVVSPTSRFIQWRAKLSRQSRDASPVLESVSLTYLPANLAPRVDRIEVNPPGVVIMKPPIAVEPDAPPTAFSLPPSAPEGSEFASPFPPIPGKNIFQKGMRSASWSAKDPNGDILSCDLFFRGEGESVWKPLARGIREEYFAWDSTLLPDGRYRIRLVATDAPDNPAGEQKSGEGISQPFVIDNTPPRVEPSPRRDEKGGAVEVKVTDETSAIRSLEFSLDAAPWRILLPVDGIPDSGSEQYRVPLESLAAGEHMLLLKATDAEGNVGAARVVVPGR